jgi:hypothetical protein
VSTGEAYLERLGVGRRPMIDECEEPRRVGRRSLWVLLLTVHESRGMRPAMGKASKNSSDEVPSVDRIGIGFDPREFNAGLI